MISSSAKPVVAVYRSTRFSWLAVWFYRLRGYEDWYWADPHAQRKIPFPPSSEWTAISQKARQQLAQYSQRYWQGASDVFLLDYLRKSLDLHFGDYSAFVRSVQQTFPDRKIRIISERILQAVVHETQPHRSYVFWIFFPFAILKVGVLVARSVALCYFFGGDVVHPKVLFVRKKVYPDLSVSATICRAVRASHLSCEGAFLGLGRARSRYGFFYLNAFQGASTLAWRAVGRVFHTFLKDASFLYRCGVAPSRYLGFLSHALTAALTTSLSSSVLTGVLMEKPLFVLLARYKRSSQRLVSLNEFFSFYPYRGFDYNHLDVYYSMNDIDAATQNMHGGSIGEIRLLPFFRQHQQSTSKGISEDLQAKLSQFSTCVVATSTQIATTGYSPWSAGELIAFVRACVDLSHRYPHVLFVLKGKKGELRAAPIALLQELERQSNVYVIHSDIPRMLPYNQFEDLLPKADVLISMAHVSTTLWQAIARGIPAIAINDVHPRSFLSEYSNLEVKLQDVAVALEYWLTISPEAWEDFSRRFCACVNITHESGLVPFAHALVSMIRTVGGTESIPHHS